MSSKSQGQKVVTFDRVQNGKVGLERIRSEVISIK